MAGTGPDRGIAWGVPRRNDGPEAGRPGSSALPTVPPARKSTPWFTSASSRREPAAGRSPRGRREGGDDAAAWRNRPTRWGKAPPGRDASAYTARIRSPSCRMQFARRTLRVVQIPADALVISRTLVGISAHERPPRFRRVHAAVRARAGRRLVVAPRRRGQAGARPRPAAGRRIPRRLVPPLAGLALDRLRRRRPRRRRPRLAVASPFHGRPAALPGPRPRVRPRRRPPHPARGRPLG